MNRWIPLGSKRTLDYYDAPVVFVPLMDEYMVCWNVTGLGEAGVAAHAAIIMFVNYDVFAVDKTCLISGQEPGYASDPIYSFPALSEENIGQAVLQLTPIRMPLETDASQAASGTLYISSPARYINGNLDTPLNNTYVGRAAASNALSRQYDYTGPTDGVYVNNAVAWSMNGSGAGTNSRLTRLTLSSNDGNGLNAGSGMAVFGCNYG